MKTFVVGYLSFFDNEIEMEKVQAENELEAVKNSKFLAENDLTGYDSVDEIDYMLSGCDATISVIEV